MKTYKYKDLEALIHRKISTCPAKCAQCTKLDARVLALPVTLFQAQLRAKGACLTAREWVGAGTARQAWEACHNADWMRWMVSTFGTHKMYSSVAWLTSAPSIRAYVSFDQLRTASALELMR